MAIAALACVAIMLCTGCGTPDAVRTNEFITDQERMTPADPLLSLVYLPDLGHLTLAEGIVIGSLAVGGERIEDPEQARVHTNLFRVMLFHELQKADAQVKESGERGFRTIRREPPAHWERLPRRTLRLDGHVSVFDMGSGSLRYFGGLLFLGLGATDFQIEGRLTDRATGEVVMEFVDRRRHLGNTPFGPNTKNLSDSTFAMKVTALHTARSLAYMLAQPVEALAGVDADTTDDEPASEEDR
jgi:hypothetical protein